MIGTSGQPPRLVVIRAGSGACDLSILRPFAPTVFDLALERDRLAVQGRYLLDAAALPSTGAPAVAFWEWPGVWEGPLPIGEDATNSWGGLPTAQEAWEGLRVALPFCADGLRAAALEEGRRTEAERWRGTRAEERAAGV